MAIQLNMTFSTRSKKEGTLNQVQTAWLRHSVPPETARDWDGLDLFSDTSDVEDALSQRLSVKEGEHGLEVLYDDQQIGEEPVRFQVGKKVLDSNGTVLHFRPEDCPVRFQVLQVQLLES